MTPVSIYRSKAEYYAKYRWKYDASAVQSFFDLSRLTKSCTCVELGAGTGIMTQQVCDKVEKIIAIEPDDKMNKLILLEKREPPNCVVITARAEAVPLPPKIADAVLVAQAIHWFEPELTRLEINRLLKHKGWLGIFRNYIEDTDLNHELALLNTTENGVQYQPQRVGQKSPYDFYFGHSGYRVLTFPFILQEDWESFFGGLMSASYAPVDGHPLFPRFFLAAEGVFNRFSSNGKLIIHATTELVLGQIF